MAVVVPVGDDPALGGDGRGELIELGHGVVEAGLLLDELSQVASARRGEVVGQGSEGVSDAAPENVLGLDRENEPRRDDGDGRPAEDAFEPGPEQARAALPEVADRKSTRLYSSHLGIS